MKFASLSMIRRGLSLLVALSTLGCLTSPVQAKPEVFSETISLEEVKAAQDTWCAALVTISETHSKGGLAESKPLAEEVIASAYGYNLGPVAFKPTWTRGDTTFRYTADGALSYFVGGDATYDDPGFAIGTPEGENPRSPWVKCEAETSVVQLFGNTATSMGWVYFEAEDGTKSMVDKTWGYVKDDDGNLRIVLHHSSTPFAGF